MLSVSDDIGGRWELPLATIQASTASGSQGLPLSNPPGSDPVVPGSAVSDMVHVVPCKAL